MSFINLYFNTKYRFKFIHRESRCENNIFLKLQCFQFFIDNEEDDIPGTHPGKGRDKTFIESREALSSDSVNAAMEGRPTE